MAAEHPAYEPMIAAAECMANAERIIYREKAALNINIDSLDFLESGLIGDEYSSITSTIGSLKAKRTSTNPDFAAYIVRQLVDHHIHRGDTVLIAMTGSFPGLNIASLCALETLGIEMYVMCSLAASSYGANQDQFTWLHMEDLLRRENALEHRSDAVTLGATGDVGGGLSEDGKAMLRSTAEKLGYDITESHTKTRQKRLRKKLRGQSTSYDLFINIGGNQFVLGANGRDLPGGWIDPANTSSWKKLARNSDGMIFDFLKDEVPVLNLLHVEAIATAAGLPVDPVERPEIGHSPIYFLGQTEE